MERMPNHESEKAPVFEGKPPIEVFNDPAETERIWGNPELTQQVRRRSELARDISEYFAGDGDEEAERRYFEAGAELLRDEENRRLVLYLPLENLNKAGAEFRSAYLDAWQEMLFSEDVREVYNEADIPEKSARAGEPERVVKAAHLLPWLMRAEFISAEDAVDLAENTDSPVLKRSILGTRKVLEDWGLMSEDLSAVLDRYESELPPVEPQEPLYVSDSRKTWLEKRDLPEKVDNDDAVLTGPFSKNAEMMRGRIAEIESELPEDALALLGGSRLKGYGSESSDLDVYLWGGNDGVREFAEKFDAGILPESFDANPELIHILFDNLWLGSEQKMLKAREKLMLPYMELPEGMNRDWSLERVEHDLLVFRLMHKGIKRKYGGVSENTRKYAEIDGASAFYDERYRRIATELFAKYVFIPKI